jgi:hypothetical protein
LEFKVDTFSVFRQFVGLFASYRRSFRVAFFILEPKSVKASFERELTGFEFSHWSVELPRQFRLPCGISRNYERKKTRRSRGSFRLCSHPKAEERCCGAWQRAKVVKRRPRISGKCQQRFLEQTQNKARRNFTLMRVENSSRTLEQKNLRREWRRRLRTSRSKKVESERRKIYGEMKSFRSETLIKTTFSPFASFSFPLPLIFLHARRFLAQDACLLLFLRLLLGAFLFSLRWLVEFTIIADYFSVIYSLPLPRFALSLTLICINFTHRLIDETLGTLSWEHMPSASNRSRISHANIVGFSRL